MSEPQYRPYPGAGEPHDAGAAWVVVVRPLLTQNSLDSMPEVSASMPRGRAECILACVAPGRTVEFEGHRWEIPSDARILDAGPDHRYAHYSAGLLRMPRLLSVELCRVIAG